MFLGTRWGDEDAKLIPAPGDPWYLQLLVRSARCRCSRRHRRTAVAAGTWLPAAGRADAAGDRAAGSDGATGERGPGDHLVADPFAGPVSGAGPSAPAIPEALLPAPPAVPPTPGGGG